MQLFIVVLIQIELRCMFIATAQTVNLNRKHNNRMDVMEMRLHKQMIKKRNIT